MSLGDEDGYGNDAGRTSDAYSTIGGTRQTRTRLPDGPTGDPYGPRRPVRSSRSLITVAGVVILLLGAIAFANMGGDKDDSNAKPGTTSGNRADAAPTSPTGTKPVTGKTGTIPSGFAHDQQGAESAASNFAVALGSADMFVASSRQAIVQATHDPAVVGKLTADLDTAYSPDFLKNVGLNEDGNAPSGLTFVSRTIPVGTKVIEHTDGSATIEVWCTGLVGMAGEGSTKPVTETWFTISEKLKWIGNDWKIESSSQTEGPLP